MKARLKDIHVMIDADLAKEFKSKLLAEGRSIKWFILKAIREYMNNK